MPTKEEIIQDLSLLPLETLERLQAYSTQLIIPDEDTLVNVNMSTMVEKAKLLGDTYFPEWTDRTKTDFGMFLVELYALFSEKDFWYINAFANESNLLNMRVYSVAFMRSVEQGYLPILTTGAEASFSFIVPPIISNLTIPRGGIELKTSTGLIFTNLSPIVVSTNVLPTTVTETLKQGRVQEGTYSFNGGSIYIPLQNIDPETLIVSVDNISYTKVANFGQSSNSSTHYMVVPEENGSISIFFGSDGFGVSPVLGATVLVSFLTTDAGKGNSSIQTCTVDKQPNSVSIDTPLMLTASTGGNTQESLAELKNNTLNYYKVRNSCINVSSTELFLNSQPEVKKSKVYVLGNTVSFYIQPSDGSVADVTLLNTIKDRLNPFISNGYEAQGNTTTYVTCGPISLDVFCLKGFNEQVIISAVKQLVQDYTNPLVLANYGDDFNLTDLSLLLRSNIAGLQNVIFNTVAGGSPANISVTAVKLKQKVSLTDITVAVYEVS